MRRNFVPEYHRASMNGKFVHFVLEYHWASIDGKSVQLAALPRQVAPPAFTGIGYRPVGIDEWKSRCISVAASWITLLLRVLTPPRGRYAILRNAIHD